MLCLPTANPYLNGNAFNKVYVVFLSERFVDLRSCDWVLKSYVKWLTTLKGFMVSVFPSMLNIAT